MVYSGSPFGLGYTCAEYIFTGSACFYINDISLELNQLLALSS